MITMTIMIITTTIRMNLTEQKLDMYIDLKVSLKRMMQRSYKIF